MSNPDELYDVSVSLHAINHLDRQFLQFVESVKPSWKRVQ